jgi:flagellar basal-body rod modification protein FlgD
MSAIASSLPGLTDQVPASATNSNTGQSAGDPLASLNGGDFVQFLITELQNQDPLNPTSSDQMLSQLSEIGQLESSTDLQTSLTGMVQQNSVSSASNMIGKQIQGTDQFNNQQTGLVTGVQVTTSGVNLALDNGSTVSLGNVTSITNPTASTSTTAGTTTGTTDGTTASS